MEGMHYIRANRKDVRNVYEKGSTFEMGKGNIVREGSDVLIISAGHLGSAVAEVLAENNISVKFKRHGVKERFGAVGTPEFLQKEFRLTAEDLLQTVENTLK